MLKLVVDNKYILRRKRRDVVAPNELESRIKNLKQDANLELSNFYNATDEEGRILCNKIYNNFLDRIEVLEGRLHRLRLIRRAA